MVALYNPLQTLQYPHGAPCLTLQLRRVSDGSFRSCQLCQDFLAPQQQQQPENAHLGYSAASSLLIKSVFFSKNTSTSHIFPSQPWLPWLFLWHPLRFASRHGGPPCGRQGCRPAPSAAPLRRCNEAPRRWRIKPWPRERPGVAQGHHGHHGVHGDSQGIPRVGDGGKDGGKRGECLRCECHIDPWKILVTYVYPLELLRYGVVSCVNV